ncbi:SDR family NAD(P)-dependent oxidoreductase [Chromobacterium piscinae]|uniref:SDR family NAD(P)-dependent oxidoreductase n=1 Tax=Chromobacterium piscinae TaxID=686831 RepID=UPI003F81EBA6
MREQLRFDVDHPIFRNHKVHGESLLPGLAYIDILYQIFRDRGYDFSCLELRDLLIFHPMVVRKDAGLDIEIECEEYAEGVWKIRVDSKSPVDDGLTGEGTCYATAQMRIVDPVSFEDEIRAGELKRDASNRSSLSEIYAGCKEYGLVHTRFMRASGTAYGVNDAVIVDLSLGRAARDSAAGFMFHPVLIDGSAIGAAVTLERGQGESQSLFLPLYYESFRAAALLNSRCLVRARRAPVVNDKELSSVTLEFFDEYGRKVAELMKLTSKRVRAGWESASAGNQDGFPPPRPSSDASPVSFSADRNAQAFLRELIAQRLQRPASQIDPDAGYYEMGLGSATMLLIMKDIEAKLGQSVSPILPFEYPTIASLANYLRETYPESFQETAQQERAPESEPQAPDAREDANGSEVAIIGISGRFPGAANIEALWSNLCEGVDSVSEIPRDRWDWRRYQKVQSSSGKRISKWGGFIDGVDRFDAKFFRITPREAELMDPQERLFLEVCWEAIEDAGYTPQNLVSAHGLAGRRKVGVFVGVMHKDYTLVGMDEMRHEEGIPLSLNTAPIANRVSYVCNFHGPSMAIDTVCSSSLTASHLAVESILRGESEVALAGGVNLSLHPAKYLTYGIAEFHSSDGRCRSFGTGGDGYVSAEGVGAVLLKPLQAAIRDGDNIYAVIKGSVINHGGSASGVTVPNPIAQAEMIDACLIKSAVDPSTISYVEAHGTGTSLGDPIEIQGLVKAFGKHTDLKQFCAIGSLKSNIGHAESAAGVCGLIKTALQLSRKTLVPSLHADQLNPYIDFDQTPFYVQRRAEPWKRPTLPTVEARKAIPRRAGISAFGASGSNAHMILEEYEAPCIDTGLRAEGAPVFIIPLSAKNEERLRAYAKKLLSHLDRHADQQRIRIADIAYTLQVGRVALTERVAFVVSSIPALQEKLGLYLEYAASQSDIERGIDGECFYRGSTPHGQSALSDPNHAEKIASWAGEERFEKIAQHWTSGGTVDWGLLHSGYRLRRISLPTYPFAEDRYWISVRREKEDEAAQWKSQQAGNDLLMLHPGWRESDAAPVPQREYSQRWVLLCGAAKVYAAELSERIPLLQLRSIPVCDGGIARMFDVAAATVFDIVKGIVQAKPTHDVLVQIVVPNVGAEQLLAGLAGIVKTARLEEPKLIGQLIEVDVDGVDLSMTTKLIDEERHPECHRVRYANGARWIESLAVIHHAESTSIPWKEQGVYLITGGAGGLGLLFAEEIASKVHEATIVIMGRSVLTEERRGRIDKLARPGLHIEYRRADIEDRAAVRALIEHIDSQHGVLSGVIHSAGLIRDNFIIRKRVDEFASVLAPKVDGLVHLDEETKHLKLDFLLIFSSGAGVIGNVGQADYATANAFMDAYASYRNRLADAGLRHGRALSVNWPLWRDGGMGVDETTERLMAENFGMVPMETSLGMQACYRSFALGIDQVMVMAGHLDRLRQSLSLNDAAKGAPALLAEPENLSDAQLREGVLGQLKEIFSEITKLDARDIYTDEAMDELGLDSVMVTQLNQKLAVIFGNLSKTLFYEKRNIGALGDYLIDEYRTACLAWVSALASTNLNVDMAQCGSETSRAQAAFLTAQVGSAAKIDAEDDGVAIIGMSARFPQAKNIEAFWNNLKTAKNLVAEIPAERWDWRVFYDNDRQHAGVKGKSYGKHGAFLEDFADFDPTFFRMSPREAMGIDPQERLFLQECWRALEDAGYAPSALTERVKQRAGVFCGITKTGFNLWNSDKSTVVYSTSFASLVNRVSYHLDWRGPCLPVDTMCSSSLVALHQACEGLRSKNIDIALSGGVNLYLHPLNYVALSQGQLLSATHESSVFGIGGDGFMPSEGVGVVLLKRLADAKRDNDNILAIIRASAINHAGRTNGYGVPDPEHQAAVIKAALERGNIDPQTITYIESAANGSEMGDAIEMKALEKAFAFSRQERGAHYRLGSVKACLGHGEAASGMAQIIKTVLQLRSKMIFPTPQPSFLNPSIEFDKLPFTLQTELCDWEELRIAGKAMPRRAGVNSFGAGGVNAHVIIEEFIASPGSLPLSEPVIFVLSAKTNQALSEYKKEWQAYLKAHQDINLLSLAYTLQTGREPMKHRFACVADSVDQLIANLDQDFKDNAQTASANEATDAGNGKTADIDTLIAQRNRQALAELWIAGAAIPWKRLYENAMPGKLTMLPTYPFAKRKLWVDATASEKVPNPQAPTSSLSQHSPMPTEADTEEHSREEAGRFIGLDALLSSFSTGLSTTTEPLSSYPGDSVIPTLDEIIGIVRDVLHRVLYLDERDEVDDATNFIELGLTSISIATYVHELNREISLGLPETIVFDHTNIRALGVHIHSLLRSESSLERVE